MLDPHGMRDLMLEKASKAPQGKARRGCQGNDDGLPFGLGGSEACAPSRASRRRYHDDVTKPTNAQGPKSPREEVSEVCGVVP